MLICPPYICCRVARETARDLAIQVSPERQPITIHSLLISGNRVMTVNCNEGYYHGYTVPEAPNVCAILFHCRCALHSERFAEHTTCESCVGDIKPITKNTDNNLQAAGKLPPHAAELREILKWSVKLHHLFRFSEHFSFVAALSTF